MAYILHIETSTTSCSVALSHSGQLKHAIAYDNGYSHAENLHPFIQRLFAESQVNIQQLSAVAISKGPGSYTGLRIGVSAAKGLAYALKIPLISIDTLQVMAVAAKLKNAEADFYCPMLDARRMEVYTRVYNASLEPCNDTKAMILDESSIQDFAPFPKICFFGNGYLKAKELLNKFPMVQFIEDIVPEAKHMITLAHLKYDGQNFEDPVYFEPFYLKDFLILKKSI